MNLNIFSVVVLFSMGYTAVAHAQTIPSLAGVLPMVAGAIPATTPGAEIPRGENGQTDAAGALPPGEVIPEAPKTFSYGTSNYSILFSPQQVMRMKQSISAYESVYRDAQSPTFAQPTIVALPEPVQEKIIEPKSYPVFFLSSIVYDAPNDWSIWIGGEKITSQNNETELDVLSVTRDSATFVWKPTYQKAIAQRKEGKQFAEVDAVKNKLANNQSASYDPQAGSITFTLRQNQTFSAGYFKVFEGFVASPDMPPLLIAGNASGDSMAAIEGPGIFQKGLENIGIGTRPLSVPPSSVPPSSVPPSSMPPRI